jgi:hypothetical protein
VLRSPRPVPIQIETEARRRLEAFVLEEPEKLRILGAHLDLESFDPEPEEVRPELVEEGLPHPLAAKIGMDPKGIQDRDRLGAPNSP